MSLHQPGDVVRMMDKGMAVQPGLRTLVELHYSEVKPEIRGYLAVDAPFPGFISALGLCDCISKVK